MHLMRRLLLPVIGLLVLAGDALAAVPAAAASQDYQPYTAPVHGGQVSATLFVVLAYSAIWLVLLVFVVSVWRRQRSVEAELDHVRRRLESDA